MGLTKTEAFTNRQNEFAAYAKALAHPARIAILEHLIQENVCICGDLVEVLPLAQATVSQHLAELKKAGLIQGTITGTSMCYCLDKAAWEKCISVFDSLIQKVKTATHCC
jgi:predicted transcriptional regulator